jgi:hypothetical protein
MVLKSNVRPHPIDERRGRDDMEARQLSAAHPRLPDGKFVPAAPLNQSSPALAPVVEVPVLASSPEQLEKCQHRLRASLAKPRLQPKAYPLKPGRHGADADGPRHARRTGLLSLL